MSASSKVMSENILNSELSKSLHSKSLVEASECLKICKRLISSNDTHDLITLSTLSYLKAIIENFGYQFIIPISKFYKFLIQKIPKSNIDLMYQICIDINDLCKKLHGTDIGYVLKLIIKEECEALLLGNEAKKSQKSILNKLCEDQIIEAPESLIESIVNEIKENNPFSINRLMDYCCSMKSIRDQYAVFPSILQPVILALEENLSSGEGIDREILLSLLSLIEHFVFRYNFNVQLSKYDTSSPEFLQPYTIIEIKLLTIYQEILDPIISILNILKTADILITQNLVRILHRLWNLFPANRMSLYDLIFSILKEIAAGGTEESKSNASELLMAALKSRETSPEFKGKLESEVILHSLFQLEKPITGIFEGGETTDIENLQIAVGFPLCAMIPSGGEWSHLIEVPEAKCIISWGFATEHYDVSFNLSRVDLPEPEMIIPTQRVRCDDTPSTGIRMLNSSGLYKLTWSNSYSWFRAKHLRYKIFVLRPFKHYAAEQVTELTKIINIIKDDDVGDTCFTNDLEFLEVGVQVNQNTIRLAALDPNSATADYILEEVQITTASEIVLSISEFLEELLTNTEKQFSSIKFGIVQDRLELFPGIEELGSVAIAKDIHAIALSSQDSLHSHTLIAVYYSGVAKSCVVHKGKILCTEDGSNLGDLERIKDIDIAQGVGMLLCMFGPAVVVLSGDSFSEDLVSLVSKIKEFVPPVIWSQSSVRESVFKEAAAVQAAAKLHYLHFKYKFSMYLSFDNLNLIALNQLNLDEL